MLGKVARLTDLIRSVTLRPASSAGLSPRGVYGQASAAGSKIDESSNSGLFRSRTARGGGRDTAASFSAKLNKAGP